jgi:two-component system response regulator AtoC
MPNISQATSLSIAPPHGSPAMEEGMPFVGVSAARRRLLLQAEITGPRLQVATIEGEPGVGKHLFAQTLHNLSAHSSLPFRRRDAREWLASETDPSALQGTLYLDRGDLLAPPGQSLLLNLVKMLQTAPADDSESLPRFILLVSAHTSLRQLAAQGDFLPDLAFRLTAVRFPIPPLRDHREDIAPIAQAIIDRICRRYHQSTAVLAAGALPRLLQHGWPGNVRELASVLEAAILDSTTGIIRPSSLQLDTPPALRAEPAAAAPAVSAHDDLSLDAVIRRHIQFVLELNHGNKLRAARQLGISRSTLYRLLGGDSGLSA